jgi:hypothetical protein
MPSWLTVIDLNVATINQIIHHKVAFLKQAPRLLILKPCLHILLIQE